MITKKDFRGCGCSINVKFDWHNRKAVEWLQNSDISEPEFCNNEMHTVNENFEGEEVCCFTSRDAFFEERFVGWIPMKYLNKV